MNNYKIGVLGGLGPLATAIFLERVINLTDSDNDQNNVDMIILNHSSVPDRTDFLLNRSCENPIPYLINDANMLENLGVKYIALPCNTAHAFYDEISSNIGIELINMVSDTINECVNKNYKKVGLMGTRGTINSKIYDKYNDNLDILIPNNEIQNKIDEFIFGKVKKNINVDYDEFNDVLNYFYENDCDGIILGCTELSVINKNLELKDKRIIDTLDVLAKKVILLDNKKIKQGE